MTVSTTKASDVFPGNGSSGPFDCEWRIFDDADVLVSLVDQATGGDTPLTLNTDYTISGAGDQAGFTVATVSPVANGTSLYVRRAIAYKQPTDFTNQGSFFPTMHEDAMDRLEMQIQQQTDDLGRTLRSNPVTGNFEAGNKRLTGVADAVNPQDAPSLLQVQGLIVGGAAPVLSSPNGSSFVGFIQQGTGAVARTGQDKLRERPSVVDYGADPTGVADSTAAFSALFAACSSGYVPTGTYTVTDVLNIPAGFKLFGDGRTKSIISVPATFNMAASGVIVMGGSEPGPTIVDIGIDFYQDTTNTVRANVIQYPPAIYAVDTPRFQIDRVRISKAWVGLDATGNTGGSHIGRLEVGALNAGLKIDGALDFFHIASYHFWCFGMVGTSLYSGVYSDGATKAWSIGKCESLAAGHLSTFKGVAEFTGAGTSALSRNIGILQLDGDGANLTYSGRELQIGQLYKTNSTGSTPFISVSDGRLIISNLHAIIAGDTGISVSGGLLQINGGFLNQLSSGSCAASVSGGRLELRNVALEIPAIARTTAYLVQTGGALVVTGSCASASGASGPVASIGSDNALNHIEGNRFNNWTVSLPSNAVLGTYGENGLGGVSFTPTLAFSTNGDFSPSYAVRQGSYWRNANGVDFQIRIFCAINAYTTASGALTVQGLPFTSLAGLDLAAVTVSHWGKITLSTNFTQLGAGISLSGGYLRLKQSGSAQNATDISPTNLPASTTNVELVISGFIPNR